MHGTIEESTKTTEEKPRNPQKEDTIKNIPIKAKKIIPASTISQFRLFLDYRTSFQFLPKELNNYMVETSTFILLQVIVDHNHFVFHIKCNCARKKTLYTS